jgi:hypothetical protein
MDDPRQEFLLEMYRQMFNDINRHIMVVWQSVGVVVGAFAIFALVEKDVISLDIATAIMILLSAWLFAHLIDSGYWYNRNLAIIANIERQFLSQGDLRDIHYYFGKHRPRNKMIAHLKIQLVLGIGLSGLVLLYHFSLRVLPGLSAPIANFDSARALPYILTVAAVLYGNHLRRRREADYVEFLTNSPGIDIDTKGIAYGGGHGFDDKSNGSGA